jgi:transposase-like protein
MDKKKHYSSPLSRNPHVRRNPEEMKGIISEIERGEISIKAACYKHGLNRNTLKRWMTKLNVHTLQDNKNKAILSSMEEHIKQNEYEYEIKRLNKALEYAKLKILGLETMIKVTEEDLKIKIRKKPGTKR